MKVGHINQTLLFDVAGSSCQLLWVSGWSGDPEWRILVRGHACERRGYM